MNDSCLGIPSGPSFRFTHLNTVCIYEFFLSHLLPTCLCQLILHDLFNPRIFGEEYKSCSPSSHNFFQSPVPSFLEHPSPSFLPIIAHLYNTTCKTTVLRIVILIFLHSRQKRPKILDQMVEGIPET